MRRAKLRQNNNWAGSARGSRAEANRGNFLHHRIIRSANLSRASCVRSQAHLHRPDLLQHTQEISLTPTLDAFFIITKERSSIQFAALFVDRHNLDAFTREGAAINCFFDSAIGRDEIHNRFGFKFVVANHTNERTDAHHADGFFLFWVEYE